MDTIEKSDWNNAFNVDLPSGKIYPQDEGMALRAYPATINPLEPSSPGFLLPLGFHLGFIQVRKSPGPGWNFFHQTFFKAFI